MVDKPAVRAVMIFADDPGATARWWATQLGDGAPVRSESGFYWYEAGGVEVGFHPSDDQRNPPGLSVVVYWSVVDVRGARSRLLGRGCRPHRGPLRVGPERQICQLLDPFGNVFGLDGG